MQREGAQIYAQKPNLGQRGITWSQENYAHLGLQARSPPDLPLISPHLHRGPGSPLPPALTPRSPLAQAEYLRLKSVQRFTEAYVAMQRLHNAGGLSLLPAQVSRAGPRAPPPA